MHTMNPIRWAVVVGLVFCGIAHAADTLESVQKKIIAQAEKNKSLSAKMASATSMDGSSMKMKSKDEGTYEYATRGDKTFFRMESKSTTTTKLADNPETKLEGSSLVVSDGEFLYSLTDMAGQKMAVKAKSEGPRGNITSKEGFELMAKTYNLKLLPDEKLDGKEVYVIEATPKKPAAGETEKHTYYYSKDSGVMVKSTTESNGARGKTTSTFTLTDIKLNPDLKPDRFKFKVPEGVKLNDMTKASAHTEEKEQPEAKTPDKDQETKKSEPPAKTTSPAPKESKKSKLPLPKIKNPLK